MKPTDKNQFIVAVLVGAVIWAVGPGLIHAYFISVDWKALGEGNIHKLLHLRPFVALLVASITFGIAVESAYIFGAALRSKTSIVFGPFAAGVLIGILQGFVTHSPVWGYIPLEVPLREPQLVSGGICGLIASSAMIPISITIRRALF